MDSHVGAAEYEVRDLLDQRKWYQLLFKGKVAADIYLESVLKPTIYSIPKVKSRSPNDYIEQGSPNFQKKQEDPIEIF